MILAFGAGQRGIVGAEGHGDGRVIDVDERQRLRIVGVNDGLADHDVVDAGDGHNVAGACGLDRDTVKALGAQQFGDAEVLERAIHTGQTIGLALLKSAVVDTDQAESAEEVGGVDVGHVSLQRSTLFIFRSRNGGDDGFEQRLKVVVVRQASVGGLVGGGVTGLGGAVDDRHFEQLVEIQVDAFVLHIVGQAEQ